MKNIQLKIKELCPNQYLEIIKFYWEFDEDLLEFRNTPKNVRTRFEIDQPELNKIIQPYSILTFYFHCKICNSFEINEMSSQSTFKLRLKNYRDPGFKCKNCIRIEREEEQRKQEIKRAELPLKLDKAVDEKRWRILDSFSYKVLDHSLKKDFYVFERYYLKTLGEKGYHRIFRELETLEGLSLIVLIRDGLDDRVIGYEHSRKLKDEFEYLSHEKKESKNRSVSVSKETNQMRLKLINDNNKHHPDSPKYAGTVIFNQRIVIEPNIEYSFAQWERSGDNLYFVLVPTDEIYPAPKQVQISRLPTSLQEGIRNFMENINPYSKDW